MARGRWTQVRVVLTDGERYEIERWQRLTSMDHGLVRRGRMLLLVAQGQRLTDVAETVGISRRYIYKWVARFQEQGLVGLQDRARTWRRRGALGASQPTVGG